MTGGGLYVRGGLNVCPQAAGPLFTRLAAGVPAGGRRFRRLRPGSAGGDGEKRVREHGQGDVPVPGAVLADLVVVQAGLVLGLAEAVLDGPPGPGDGGEFRQCDRAGRPAAEESQLKVAFLARVQGPAGQQPVPGAGGGEQRPVVKPGSLGPVCAAQPLPGLRRSTVSTTPRSWTLLPSAASCAKN